jgi:YVTN family beta-propeller protein
VSGLLEPGTTVGAYRVDGFVGRGGMGVVYAAEHVALGRRVALKVVAPELRSDQGFRDRFLREARLAASLEHPNIIPVYDAGEDGDTLYLAMRFVEGENLGAILEREHLLDPQRALKILGKVADALDEAHRSGLVHRDVKPDNILLAWGEGSVYLTDFGLVRRLDSRTRLTKTGYMMGTLNYMAPEVLRGEDIDARTDVYSLTCVLFECLTGGPPFERPTEPAVISSHLVDPPPAPSAVRAGLPRALDPVIGRGMAKERTDRYPSCGELIAAARDAIQAEVLPPAPTTPPRPIDPTLPAAPERAGAGLGPTLPAPAPPTDGGRPGRRRAIVLGAIVGVGVLAAVFVVPPLLDDDRETASVTGASTATTGATGRTGSTGASGPGADLPPGVTRIATVSGSPTFISVDAGAVWVTVGEGTLIRVDKGSGELTEIGVGPDPARVTFTGSESRGDAWVVNRGDGTVTRVPIPAGERPTTSIPVGPEPGRPLAPDRTQAVWVPVAAEDRLVRIDAGSGETTPIAVGSGPVTVSSAAGSLWTANATSGSISRVDPDARVEIIEIGVGANPTSLQPAADLLWVANTGEGTVSVVDPAIDQEIDEVRVGPGPTGVTNDEAGGVWVQNREGDSVSRIDVETLRSEEFPVGSSPRGMAKADGALWLITGDGILFRIEPRTGAMTPLDLGIPPVAISADEPGAVWIVAEGGDVLRVATDALP